jgi:hypothetical protein
LAKTYRFDGYNADVDRLTTKIQTYLAENHFDVAFSKDESDAVPVLFIQARKKGALRTASGTRRSIDITVKGTPDSFEVILGTGEWGNNLIVSAPLFVIPVIGITATAARLYSAKRFESHLWKKIKEIAELMRNSATTSKKDAVRSSDLTEYNCDYMEGYPGWETQVLGGKIILEKQPAETDRLIFKAPDGEQITIPASKIEKASIILRKKGIRENDLMLEITCKDKNGSTINPILNLADNIITDVLIGINEFVESDAQRISRVN